MQSLFRRSLVAAFAVGASLLSASFDASAQQTSTMDKAKASGKLLVGIRNDFPPIGSVDESGNPIGMGVELGAAIAKKLGFEAVFVPVTSRTRFPLLEQGAIDIEVGVTTPTVEREKTVDFTIPYVWDAADLIIKKGASGKLSDYGPPKKIATVQGSFIVTLIKERLPNVELTLFQEFPEAVAALQNGRVDAVGINRASAIAFLKRDPDKLALSEDYFKDPWAITVRKNDSGIRVAVNNALQELWSDGTYAKLYEKPYQLQPGIK
jgi:polar amino acid transport system substrate-binding protein